MTIPFNFVPGWCGHAAFLKNCTGRRFFGEKLPMDVDSGWMKCEHQDAEYLISSCFTKPWCTVCQSCQSLAQLKTLLRTEHGEGIVETVCDTLSILGGNEANTYEYVSKPLGKWTIDKRTSGESKGTSLSSTVRIT